MRHERKLARGGSSGRRGREEADVELEQKLLVAEDCQDVEVEQKFVVPGDCRLRLEEAGAVLVREAGLGDIYWDTAGGSLLARDHWLRQRSG